MFLNHTSLLIIALWLLAANAAMGQMANHGQVITVTPGAVIVSGDVTNQGEIANNGDWYVSGNWTNAGKYQELTGTVRLNNTTENQSILHSGQAFYKLITTGTAKMLEDSLSITHQLELNNALIIPQPNSIFLMRKTATLTGASENAYVDGRLYWEGTGERFYPVGNFLGYAPLWLSEERSGTTPLSDPVVGINLASPEAATKVDSSLRNVSMVRYWERTVVRGTSENAYVTLSVLSDENVPTLDSVVVSGTNDRSGSFQSLGQTQVWGNRFSGRVSSYDYANVRWMAIGVLAAPDKSGLIYVPNAFAPASADSEERVFKLYGVNIAPEGLQLIIYNRWGNIVFSSQSLSQIAEMGWNGRNQTTQNEEVQGVYTYVLKGKFNTGKGFEKKGTITLIR